MFCTRNLAAIEYALNFITCALVLRLVHHSQDDVTLTNHLQTTNGNCQLNFDLSLFSSSECYNRCKNLRKGCYSVHIQNMHVW